MDAMSPFQKVNYLDRTKVKTQTYGPGPVIPKHLGGQGAPEKKYAVAKNKLNPGKQIYLNEHNGYVRAQQQNPNIKNQLNMFGKPLLSP